MSFLCLFCNPARCRTGGDVDNWTSERRGQRGRSANQSSLRRQTSVGRRVCSFLSPLSPLTLGCYLIFQRLQPALLSFFLSLSSTLEPIRQSRTIPICPVVLLVIPLALFFFWHSGRQTLSFFVLFLSLVEPHHSRKRAGLGCPWGTNLDCHLQTFDCGIRLTRV